MKAALASRELTRASTCLLRQAAGARTETLNLAGFPYLSYESLMSTACGGCLTVMTHRGGNATGSFSPLVEEPSSGLHSEPHHAVPHPGTGEGPTFRGEYQGPSRSEEEVHGLEREIEFYGGNA